MTYQCFLIEPVWGEEDKDYPFSGWEPYRDISGWKRADTGELYARNSDAPIGSMWRAYWYPKNMTWDNETEPHLLVRCPNGESTRDWDIDSRCSNCGKPEDRLHRCWVRSGEPPVLTVSKGPGTSCDAGHGSILLPHWHGMLENGVLRPC